jgi:hypothetical protein
MAQVYKCIDQGGKTIYAESPCTGSSNGSNNTLKIKESSEADVLVAKQRQEKDETLIQNFQQTRKQEEAQAEQRRGQLERQESQAKLQNSIDGHIPNHYDNVRAIVQQAEWNRKRN